MNDLKMPRQISITEYNKHEGKCTNCGKPHGNPNDSDIGSDNILAQYTCEGCGMAWEAHYHLEDVHIQTEPERLSRFDAYVMVFIEVSREDSKIGKEAARETLGVWKEMLAKNGVKSLEDVNARIDKLMGISKPILPEDRASLSHQVGLSVSDYKKSFGLTQEALDDAIQCAKDEIIERMEWEGVGEVWLDFNFTAEFEEFDSNNSFHASGYFNITIEGPILKIAEIESMIDQEDEDE